MECSWECGSTGPGAVMAGDTNGASSVPGKDKKSNAMHSKGQLSILIIMAFKLSALAYP